MKGLPFCWVPVHCWVWQVHQFMSSSGRMFPGDPSLQHCLRIPDLHRVRAVEARGAMGTWAPEISRARLHRGRPDIMPYHYTVECVPDPALLDLSARHGQSGGDRRAQDRAWTQTPHCRWPPLKQSTRCNLPLMATVSHRPSTAEVTPPLGSAGSCLPLQQRLPLPCCRKSLRHFDTAPVRTRGQTF